MKLVRLSATFAASSAFAGVERIRAGTGVEEAEGESSDAGDVSPRGGDGGGGGRVRLRGGGMVLKLPLLGLR